MKLFLTLVSLVMITANAYSSQVKEEIVNYEKLLNECNINIKRPRVVGLNRPFWTPDEITDRRYADFMLDLLSGLNFCSGLKMDTKITINIVNNDDHFVPNKIERESENSYLVRESDSKKLAKRLAKNRTEKIGQQVKLYKASILANCNVEMKRFFTSRYEVEELDYLNFMKHFYVEAQGCVNLKMPEKYTISVARENAVVDPFKFWVDYPGNLFGADISYDGKRMYVVGHRSAIEIVEELNQNL